MDFIARELMEIARELIEARIDIQARYDYWNRTVFDGKLPNIPVKWGRSRVWGGVCKGMINRTQGTGEVHVIEISDFIVDDPAVIDRIILHEMIHALMYLSGKGGHGWEFDMLRRQYSSKSGVEINRTEDISNFVPPEEFKGTEKGVVVQQAEGKKGLVVYNLNYFKRSLDAIKGYYESLASFYRSKGKRVNVTFLISNAKDLWKYPEKRSIMRGSYPIQDSLLDTVLQNGVVLAEVVA